MSADFGVHIAFTLVNHLTEGDKIKQIDLFTEENKLQKGKLKSDHPVEHLLFYFKNRRKDAQTLFRKLFTF